ncbi:hypothetical protein O1611_g6564 [Lasiodiplodia mahajangana]|uniref:Uncharacterized protein n=1 Tax=Lasiodiplodia mahajangana TaxID=1108764 RepID=A0ACC2JI17_9PEZI|nr:hypothetical protein O1611_g6564 [Lasiodiplodia mahajangana]
MEYNSDLLQNLGETDNDADTNGIDMWHFLSHPHLAGLSQTANDISAVPPYGHMIAGPGAAEAMQNHEAVDLATSGFEDFPYFPPVDSQQSIHPYDYRLSNEDDSLAVPQGSGMQQAAYLPASHFNIIDGIVPDPAKQYNEQRQQMRFVDPSLTNRSSAKQELPILGFVSTESLATTSATAAVFANALIRRPETSIVISGPNILITRLNMTFHPRRHHATPRDVHTRAGRTM